ncbi:4-hydroxy-tetrahydrodipicolinate reductase [Rhodocytophaga aerolata]|uniref:4-hydroxy-tetrahydrodipicolinate reductase n=1 Tax=Rhodocytophaga aerolata TaxID=455078 RepID=A0ABT8R4C6_9BACT|nr:4-hydroxy-tetrahydrodipicolinate reductase [Rhodocytophaga aerolata]MDO1446083.1 4-hydroxy-tetrahydrodipicolinate reductase [Rhodocytophaga aerolata]
MNILLLGYGKMGKEIEKVAISRGHQIAHKIDLNNVEDLHTINPTEIDVAIEFSGPEAAVANLLFCLNNNIPVVSGSTGWLDRKSEIDSICLQKKGAFFYASNYSLGVNVFFHVNRVLAKVMSRYPTYNVAIEETHHTEKKDAPSGTALTLAKDVIDHIKTKTSWVNASAHELSQLSIVSKREPQVPGTHLVKYDSQVDSIEIKHIAHSREGFALGAVVAAEWLPRKVGVFGMEDMMEF